MVKGIFLAVAIGMLFSITKPSPEDIVKHTMQKCMSSEEYAKYLVAAAMGTHRSNVRTTLIDIMVFSSQGRIAVYEGPFHSSISIDKETVAIGALHTFITPSCEDIRKNKWKL